MLGSTGRRPVLRGGSPRSARKVRLRVCRSKALGGAETSCAAFWFHDALSKFALANRLRQQATGLCSRESSFPPLEMNRDRKLRRHLSHETRLTWLTLGACAPALLIALVLLWFGDFSAKVSWTLTLVIVGCAFGFLASVREHIVRPLQTMSNLLAALREGDYSIRARGARVGDALGEVLLEINQLGETLRVQRLGAFEATALLRTIMA